MADRTANTTATILGPDGTPLDKPATFLSSDEAQLLRDYQRWGEMNGLQGTMTCNSCGKQMEVYVQSDIGFFCDCRVLFWRPS